MGIILQFFFEVENRSPKPGPVTPPPKKPHCGVVSFVGPPPKPQLWAQCGVVSFVGPPQKPHCGVVSFVVTRSTGTGDRDLTRWSHLW
jgi:hypothetical protein